jgi:hypothetical protein
MKTMAAAIGSALGCFMLLLSLTLTGFTGLSCDDIFLSSVERTVSFKNRFLGENCREYYKHSGMRYMEDTALDYLRYFITKFGNIFVRINSVGTIFFITMILINMRWKHFPHIFSMRGDGNNCWC